MDTRNSTGPATAGSVNGTVAEDGSIDLNLAGGQLVGTATSTQMSGTFFVPGGDVFGLNCPSGTGNWSMTR